MTMARIKIKDLPKDMKVSKEEMRKIRGGYYYDTMSFQVSGTYYPYLTSYFAQPTVSNVYTGALTPIRWGTPVDSTPCKCMGMSQDPKTFLPV